MSDSATWASRQDDDHIYTVGHSPCDFDEMPAMLQSNEITHLADVRSFPLSTKCLQWNQSAIIGALPPDIEYWWIPKLGARSPQTHRARPQASLRWTALFCP